MWTIIAPKFPELNGMPILIGILRFPNYEEPNTAALQNKILRSTEANK